MNSALSASKGLLLRRLLNPSSSLLLRHLCTGSQRPEVDGATDTQALEYYMRRRPDLASSRFLQNLINSSPNVTPPPPPLPPGVDEASVTEAVEFLKHTPEQDWASSQFLQTLIDSSPNLIPHIARRLPTDFEAIKFIRLVQPYSVWEIVAPTPHSSPFLRVLPRFERGCGHEESYWELYRVFKERKLGLTAMDSAVMMLEFATPQLVDKCVLVYDEIDPSLKDVHVRNVFIRALLQAGCVDHARKVFDEMLQPESEVKPNHETLNYLPNFMPSINADEIVEMVLRCCQFSVFPEHSTVASLVQKMCKEGKIVEASGFLDELMKFHAPSLKDIHPRNVFISALLQADCVDHALKVLDEMLQPESEVKPNQDTLDTLYKFMPSVDEIVKLVLRFCQISVFPEHSMVASLVQKMCKEGKIVEACGFLDELRKFHTSSNDCFDLVRKTLKGKGKGKGKRNTKAYLTEMKEKEIYPSNKTVQLFLEKLLELGMVDEAIELFKWFQKGIDCVDIGTYNALIGILCFGRRLKELEDVLAQMTTSGVKPNAATYRDIVLSLNEKKSLMKASRLVDKILMEECSPDAIVELLRENWLSEVK